MISLRAGRLAGTSAVLLCASALLAGCGNSGGPGGNQPAAAEVKITLSDAGCQPQPASVPAGPVRFSITNSGSSKVTEAELQQDGRIIGEKESLTPGLSGDFTLRLAGGTYSVYCPGGAKDTWTFTVNGGAPGATPPADTSLADATKGYHDYVVGEVDQLTTTTKTFTDAVRAGDMAKAKQAFAPARQIGRASCRERV